MGNARRRNGVGDLSSLFGCVSFHEGPDFLQGGNPARSVREIVVVIPDRHVFDCFTCALERTGHLLALPGFDHRIARSVDQQDRGTEVRRKLGGGGVLKLVLLRRRITDRPKYISERATVWTKAIAHIVDVIDQIAWAGDRYDAGIEVRRGGCALSAE